MFPEYNKSDFNNALKAIFEADVPAPVAPEPEMQQKNTNVVLRELKQLVVNLKNGLVQSLADLDNRMAAKMQELTSAVGAMAGTTAELQKQVEDLRKEFESKSNEVDQVLVKVQEMLPELQTDLKLGQAINKVAQHLKGIKKELTAKSKEAERLHKDLEMARSSAHADMSSLQQQLNDLDDFSQEVEHKLAAAKKRIEELETEKSDLGRMKVDKNIFHDNPKNPLDMAHTKHFGKFNLQEHLERARKYQGQPND